MSLSSRRCRPRASCWRAGPAVVLLTHGSRGATVVSATADAVVPAPPASVVDTIGAGDAFGGGWLAAWIAGGLGRADLADFDALVRSDAVCRTGRRAHVRAGRRRASVRAAARRRVVHGRGGRPIQPDSALMLGTLKRAGTVLDLFTTEDPEWGVTATAQRLGIGKSLAHDILSSLAAIGLLQRVGHGRYRLGWRTISLASVLLRTSDLKAQARPIVRELSERQRLPVSLAAWDCDRIIYLDCRRDRRHWGLRAPCGDRGTARRIRDRQGAACRPPGPRGRDAVERWAGAQRAHLA